MALAVRFVTESFVRTAIRTALWPLSQPTKKLKNGRSARRNGVKPGSLDPAKPRSATGVGTRDMKEMRELYGASDEPDLNSSVNSSDVFDVMRISPVPGSSACS